MAMALWLDAYLHQCTPMAGYKNMAAIVKVESGGNPWALGDNTTHGPVSPAPKSYLEAVAKAKALIARGHNIDIGLTQVNNKHLREFGMTVEQVLEPCTNLRVGSSILYGFYKKASSKYGETEKALYHAFSGYNTGSLYAGGAYVQRILNAAGIPGKYSLVAYEMKNALPRRSYFGGERILASHSNTILAFQGK